ncbi:MAG: glycosyl transferase group 1 [Solirubrobacterales bacterium]|nr:glycosyl transferase group 1 [Solirubrobacterales bacterium]
MPLPVTMVIQAWDPVVGGAQRQLQQLTGRLAARGVRVTVVTRWAPGLRRFEHLETHDLRRVGAGWSSRAASARFVAAGTGHVVASRPAVIHAHDLLSASMCAAMGAGLARVALVVKVASVGPGGDLDVLLSRPGGHARLRTLLARVDAFACVSTDVIAELREHGAPADRCLAIANGVDTDRFRPPPATPGHRRAVRASLGLPLDGDLVLSGGRLRPVKRLDTLVQACGITGAHLVLVGEGPEASRLAGLPGVTVRPPVDDLRPYMDAAHVYASASQTEGLSNAVLEAMAGGIPVAAVPASGVRELLADGRGALAADAGAPALALAIGNLLPEPARTNAARSARAYIERHHDLETTATHLASLYRRLARPALRPV